MGNKFPWFPLYVRDFAFDGNVEAMTTQEVGAYILLLCKAWFEEPCGSLPADDAILARWARLDTDTWRKVKFSVLLPFTLTESTGRYHQKRMQQEHRKLMDSVKSRSQAGKKGAQRRWGNRQKGDPDPPPDDGIANAQALRTQCDGNASMSVCVNSSSEKNSKENSHSHTPGVGGAGGGGKNGKAMAMPSTRGPAVRYLDPLFDAFWKAYPIQEGEQAARREWDNLSPSEELVATMLAALEKHKRSERWQNRRFIPHAKTWISDRRWEDVLPEQKPKESQAEMLARLRREKECRQNGTTHGGKGTLSSSA